MVNRIINPLKSRSFFIFGSRGVGKSTWIRENLKGSNVLYFNLLDPNIYEQFLLEPGRMLEIINTKENVKKIVVIDEVQRIPALLDIAHESISRFKRIFVLTGSSARRLKQKGVNLLAGRASVYYMFPFSMEELKDSFDLKKALEWGLLPESYFANQEIEAHEYLKSYVITYIEKEIQQEQWVRKIEPFRKFLNIAAQMNSKIINKSKIAQQIGVESSTVESYFEILEDTLLGFRLPGFETSIRKQSKLAEKFYFVDTGLVRAIEKTLSIPLIDHSSYYGGFFETFIVLEVKKFIEYHRLEWSMSYLCTKDNVEIDLVISRPKKSPLLIEIKSAKTIFESDLKSLVLLGADLDKINKKICPKILISQDPTDRIINEVDCLNYRSLWKKLREVASEKI